MRIPTWVREQFALAVIFDARRNRKQRSSSSTVLAAEIQLLEFRVLLSGIEMKPFDAPNLVRAGHGDTGLVPLTTAGPTGYTPAQIRHAYGFDQISFNGVAGNGAGTTIAIVDAYDDPNIANDLHQFDVAYGLPDPPSFTKVNQNGSTSNLPKPDAGWITEIALDVEWAHAIAPGANILLVESRSSSDSDLMTAVNTARNWSGVVVVSMSWGGSEDPSETFDDSTFNTPRGHGGVTFVASSGDDGAPNSYPSASPNVLSVGGTTLRLTTQGNITSESAWSGSGGGISSVETQPAYQRGIVTQTTAFRANPDVSYDADPNTGFGVYDSYNNGTSRPWGQWGGTSDAAPQWAALIAIADQGRILAGKGALDGPTQTLPMLYAMSSSDFHDITTGSSTGSPNYSAAPGYDLATGLGSPYANRIVSDFVGVPAGPTLTAISTLGPAYQQTPFNISYATFLAASNAADSNGQPIQFRINAIQNGTLSIVHNGVTTAVTASPTTGTLFGAGDTLIWTSPAGLSGNAVNAFSVSAFDGSSNSASAVQVTISIATLGTQFNLSGPWIVVNSTGVALGLGSITQTGASVTLVNASGSSASAQYTAQNQITSTNFYGHGTAVGTIDTSTADQGRILWSDGTVWLRESLGGQYAVTTPGSSNVSLGSIVQTGTALTLVNGTSTVTGLISALGQLTLAGLSGGATFADGTITIAATGQVWTKLDLPTNYVSSLGGAASVVQNGTTSLVFVNNLGQTSPGYWINSTQVIATGFGNAVGTVGAGKIAWSTGEVWTENIVVNGTSSGAGTTKLAVTMPATSMATPVSVTSYINPSNGTSQFMVQNGTNTALLINGKGIMALGVFTSASQITVAAWGNLVGTLSGSSIIWSNSTSWSQSNAVSSPVTVTSYVNLTNTLPQYLVQNGTASAAFINGRGSMVLGTFISPNQAIVAAWNNDVATISSSAIAWSDGSTWNQASGPLPLVTATDTNGAVSHVQLLTRTTLSGFDGVLAGMTGTRQNGKIVWSNGTVWDNFDFNALNALFQMSVGYP